MNIKNLLARYKFSPLYYSDGSPCYFRASCLAVFAACLMLHVLLKPFSADTEEQLQAQELMASNELYLGDETPAAATMYDPAAASANNIYTAADRGYLAPESINQSAEVQTADVNFEDSSWSLFGFMSGENKEHKALLANRKKALNELIDGAAFLTSCGNINAGYVGCRFDLSKEIRPFYDASVEAADDGFLITLVAKGKQRQDPCSKFMVNSEGIYMAFDSSGHENLKCFANSEVSNQIVSINRAINSMGGNQDTSSALAVK